MSKEQLAKKSLPPSADKAAQRKYRAALKYKEVDGKWMIDIQKKNGSVRPVDFISGDQNAEQEILRKFDSKLAAIDFEERCFHEKERLKTCGEDWLQYQTISRKKLNIGKDQQALHDNLVNEMRDNTDSLHERHDEAEEAAEARHKESLAKGDKDARKGEGSASGLLPMISFLYMFGSDGRSNRFDSDNLEHMRVAFQNVIIYLSYEIYSYNKFK